MKKHNFRKWLCEKGYLFPAKTIGPFTHLLMDGGNLKIPEDVMDEFYMRYAESVKNEENNYVVEQRTEFFPFLVDMDIIENEKIQPQKIREYITLIQQVLKEFFQEAPEKSFVVIVCERKCTFLGEQGTKHGIHFVFPNLIVNSEIALLIRNAVILKATTMYGMRKATNTWSQVFDITVFKGNGLRMPGSRKMVNCETCKGYKHRNWCPECNGRGKNDVGRVYQLTMIVDGDGGMNNEELEKLQCDMESLVKKTSLRTNITELPYKYKIPGWAQNKTVTGKREMEETVKMENQNKMRKKTENSDAKMEILSAHDVRAKLISELIQEKFPHSPIVTSVSLGYNRKYYLASSSSRYCQNKGEEHESNHVFFHVDARGIRQKCHCKCDVSRQYGKCMDFTSNVVSLKRGMKSKLFKNNKIETKIFSTRKIDPTKDYSEEDANFLLDFIRTLK